jgi:hypothetical protein
MDPRAKISIEITAEMAVEVAQALHRELATVIRKHVPNVNRTEFANRILFVLADYKFTSSDSIPDYDSQKQVAT